LPPGVTVAARVGALLPLRRVVVSPSSCLLQAPPPPSPPPSAQPLPPPRHLRRPLAPLPLLGHHRPLSEDDDGSSRRGWCVRHGAGSSFHTLPIPRRNLVRPPPLRFVLRSVVLLSLCYCGANASWCCGTGRRAWSSAALHQGQPFRSLPTTVRPACGSTVPPRQLKLFVGSSLTVRASSPSEHVRPA
jgi:hypothetical protein